jgi:hypothetical protein
MIKIVLKKVNNLVVKTIVACGTSDSHEMAIIFDVPHLHEVIINKENKYKIPLPVVVQQYINHNATLYKVYVLAEDTFVQARESIRDFEPSGNFLKKFTNVARN